MDWDCDERVGGIEDLASCAAMVIKKMRREQR